MAYGRRKIVIPKKLMCLLSQEEFESVIAHELEHLRWCDPFLKISLYIVSAFFWWIPVNRWLKKIDDEQEQACDASIAQYQCRNEELASALFKTLQFSFKQQENYQLIAPLARNSNNTLLRMQKLLRPGDSPRSSSFLAFCGIFAALGCFLMISFHIC